MGRSSDGPELSPETRRKVKLLDWATGILRVVWFAQLIPVLLCKFGVLDGVWWVVALAVAALCMLGQWLCARWADRLEGTRRRRDEEERRSRDDGSGLSLECLD